MGDEKCKPRKGKEVINLGVGEPDFDTPVHIKEAACQALWKGMTKYTAVGGVASLKQAIAEKFLRDNQLRYEPKEILVSCGGKHSIYNLMQAALNPGDEVILPAPYWPSFLDMALLAEARPVVLPCGIDDGYKLTPERLRHALNSRTRMLILNSPSNPTGAVYSAAELAALGDVLLDYPEVLLLSDDMYEHILFEGRFSNMLNVHPELKERCVIVNGVSKAYAMTGWRIGYAAGPQGLIAAMTNLQGQSTSNPTAVADMTREFKARHDMVVHALNLVPGIRCAPAGGAFYAFANTEECTAALFQAGRLAENSDEALCDFLLEQGGLSLVPGTAFGLPGHLRLSFATSRELLQRALGEISRLCA